MEKVRRLRDEAKKRGKRGLTLAQLAQILMEAKRDGSACVFVFAYVYLCVSAVYLFMYLSPPHTSSARSVIQDTFRFQICETLIMIHFFTC
jgi:HEPN domain-containing protein